MQISVIIPVYKPGEYIFRCLQAVAKQTMAKDLYEVIIVLNGCCEPYYQLLDEYLNKNLIDVNTKLLQTDIQGVSNARNMGIDKSIGEYITFIDDDDWISENYLTELLAKADTDCIVEANVLQIEQTTNKPIDHFLTSAYEKAIGRKRLTFYNSRSFLSSACCKLIPHTVIRNDRFNTNYPLGEDSLFMFQISKRIRNIRIASPQTVYYVLHRPCSASRKIYSYPFRVSLAFKLVKSYICVYAKDIRHYDFVFFLTRIAATLRKLFRKTYQ